MLIGYVSDERFVALADVLIEFQRDGQTVTILRSTPRGAIHADVLAGDPCSRLVNRDLAQNGSMNAHPVNRFTSACSQTASWGTSGRARSKPRV